MYMQTTVKIEN